MCEQCWASRNFNPRFRDSTIRDPGLPRTDTSKLGTYLKSQFWKIITLFHHGDGIPLSVQTDVNKNTIESRKDGGKLLS